MTILCSQYIGFLSSANATRGDCNATTVECRFQVMDSLFSLSLSLSLCLHIHVPIYSLEQISIPSVVHTQTTQAVMSYARKCALHWRRIARERRLKAQAVSGQVAAMLLPHQACGQANKPQVLPPSSDLWNNIARYIEYYKIIVQLIFFCYIICDLL